MKYYILFSILFFGSRNICVAQNEGYPSDSLALQNGMMIHRVLGEVTLYDYGQTSMDMELNQIDLWFGSYYYMVVSLNTPGTSSDSRFVYTLEETQRFLSKLLAMLEIGTNRDMPNPIRRQIRPNIFLEAGIPVWVEDKDYSFGVINDYNNGVIFYMVTESSPNGLDETDITGVFLTNSIVEDFTVNDFEDFSERLETAVSSLLVTIQGINEDEDIISYEEPIGIRGQLADYSVLTDNGYSVLKSNVHNTENVEILADLQFSRDPRRVRLIDYDDQFEEFKIVYDDQLNFYVEEIVTFDLLLEELLDVLAGYDATGVLDMAFEILDNGSIVSKFTIVY